MDLSINKLVDGALVTCTQPSAVWWTKLMKTVFYYYFYFVSISSSCIVKSLISNKRVIYNLGI